MRRRTVKLIRHRKTLPSGRHASLRFLDSAYADWGGPIRGQELDAPKVQRRAVELERQEKAVAVLRTTYPDDLRPLSCTRDRVDERKPLTSTERQTQFKETSVDIHDQRGCVYSKRLGTLTMTLTTEREEAMKTGVVVSVGCGPAWPHIANWLVFE